MGLLVLLVTLGLALLAACVAKALATRFSGGAETGQGGFGAGQSIAKGGLERLGKSRLAAMPIDRAFRRRIERSLVRAGIAMPAGTYWALCVVCAFAGAAAGLALTMAVIPANAVLGIPAIACCALLGALAPGLYVSSLTRKRREAIEATMSYTLDLLSVVVNSGQTIEQGIRTIAEKSDGPLAEEFAIADKQISVLGASPAAALRDMAERVDLPLLSLFCASVMQALASGSPLADELKIQAEEAADRYYQMIDERAAKISSKMVFPLAFMMLPSIMIIALVPMVLRLAEQMPGLLPGLA